MPLLNWASFNNFSDPASFLGHLFPSRFHQMALQSNSIKPGSANISRWVIPGLIILSCAIAFYFTTQFDRVPEILKRGIQPSDFPQLTLLLLIGLIHITSKFIAMITGRITKTTTNIVMRAGLMTKTPTNIVMRRCIMTKTTTKIEPEIKKSLMGP